MYPYPLPIWVVVIWPYLFVPNFLMYPCPCLGAMLSGEDAFRCSLDSTVYGEVWWFTSAWDDLQCSISPHITNFNNKFQCNVDNRCTAHNITLTMLTLPKTCLPALTEHLFWQLKSLLYDVADRLTTLEHNNVPWRTRLSGMHQLSVFIP